MILVQHPPLNDTATDSNYNYNSTSNRTPNDPQTMMSMFPRRQTSKINYYYDEDDDDDDDEILLPSMVESPSGSAETFSSGEADAAGLANNASSPSGNGFPLFFSSSSRMQERFSTTLDNVRNQRRRSRRELEGVDFDSTTSSNVFNNFETTEPSNSSILLGANIIKRQLSGGGDSPVRASQQHQSNHQRRTPQPQNKEPIHNNNSKAAAAGDWDPWKTHSKTVRGHMLDYNKELYKSTTKTKPTNRQRQQEILSKGDNYFEVTKPNNNNTNKNLSHRGEISKESKPISPKNKIHAAAAASTMIKDTKNHMVQRVSELDDSTFASSTSGNGVGYLPNKLVNGLTCGGLHNLNNNSNNNNNTEYHNLNCSDPQQFLPSALMQTRSEENRQTRHHGNNNINSFGSSLDDDEQLETSTLDFLANLHVMEEDLNFVFSDLNDQEQRAGRKQQQQQKQQIQRHQHHRVTTTSSFVTAASTPFETMLSSNSSLVDKLSKDPAYQHALKAGTLWQSLTSQHVRFPAHWWDGKLPIGPPLGSIKKRPWSYVGRHRVKGDPKLHRLIGNRSSSGRILLHLLVKDAISGVVTEDICCGVYHPNARGIRTTTNYDQALEDCRDVWLAHRRRAVNDDDNSSNNNSNDATWMTTLESLLIHQNKGRIHPSPLGAQGGKHIITNQNMRTVFGSKPPVYTIFCTESELYELFQNQLDGSIPASVVLLRRYLQYQMS